MARVRFCDSCGARPPEGASDRQVAERIWRLGLMLAAAESNGDTGMVRC
ncbi:hypothetical protein [Streptomyces sp. NPDC002403]